MSNLLFDPGPFIRYYFCSIGKPDLKWLVIPEEQLLKGMLVAGMNGWIANGFVEMQASQGNGVLYEDYYRIKAGVLLAPPGNGGADLSEFAAKNYSFFLHFFCTQLY